MGKYAALVYAAENSRPAPNSAELEQDIKEFNAFLNGAASAGVLKGGDDFQPTCSASTVRVRDGKTSSTGGPLAVAS